MSFKLLNIDEFKIWLQNQKIKRTIGLIQIHHTYSPSYQHFDGSNHIKLQQNMKNYHVKANGWSDIGQHFTIYPDGKIATGRPLSETPAGIYGANTGAICIECLGNFDKGGDNMTDTQKNTIVATIRLLLDKFGLNACDNVVYHAWYSSDGRPLGDYYKGNSSKTCPGTNFFGGNTFTAYEKNLLPLLKENIMKEVTTINDIIWELANAKIITNSKLWMKKCEEDINVYWLCRKMANKLRGIL